MKSDYGTIANGRDQNIVRKGEINYKTYAISSFYADFNKSLNTKFQMRNKKSVCAC